LLLLPCAACPLIALRICVVGSLTRLPVVLSLRSVGPRSVAGDSARSPHNRSEHELDLVDL
jgi:hypothetical protein